MDLSIVIPVYNESQKIALDITAASLFMHRENLNGEIIIVDDGSEDDTEDAAENTELIGTATREIIRYSRHRGKGYAVRTGIAHSSGDTVMFIDSGNCVPFSDVLKGLELVWEDKCDIAHGSRRLPDSRIVSPHRLSRRFTSFLFRRMLTMCMHVPPELTDTQCGLKIYKGHIGRSLYRDAITDGFMFDVEIIKKALRDGYRIREFPIEWSADPDSRLSLTRTPFGVISELKAIKKNLTS
jgi:dolichyl-phosphate beta-glucosyltransferase